MSVDNDLHSYNSVLAFYSLDILINQMVMVAVMKSYKVTFNNHSENDINM